MGIRVHAALLILIIASTAAAASSPSDADLRAIATMSSFDATPEERDRAEAELLASNSADALEALFDSLNDPIPGDLSVESMYKYASHKLDRRPGDTRPPLTAQAAFSKGWDLQSWMTAQRLRVWRELSRTAEPAEKRYGVLAKLGDRAAGRIQWKELIDAWCMSTHPVEERPEIEAALRRGLTNPGLDRFQRKKCFACLTPQLIGHTRRERHFEFVVRTLWAERHDPERWWTYDEIWHLGHTRTEWLHCFSSRDARVMAMMIEEMRRIQKRGMELNNQLCFKLGIVFGLEMPDGSYTINSHHWKKPPDETWVQTIRDWMTENEAQVLARAQAMMDEARAGEDE